MLQEFTFSHISARVHRGGSRRRAGLLAVALARALGCVVVLCSPCKLHAQTQAEHDNGGAAADCLPSGAGYLRARLLGVWRAELTWGNQGTECTGAVRPTDGGIRMRFSRTDDPQLGKLVLVFGIATLKEGQNARNVPVNVTLIREGQGQFYSTQGDDKCTLDRITQEPIVGIPHRSRAYRVVARGFCTEPARAVRGNGAVLVSRFDYAGRVDFDSEAAPEEDSLSTIAGAP